MARLDQFIAVLHQKQCDALLAVAGHPLALVSGSTRRPLTPKPLGDGQILALVRELAGPERAGQVGAGASTDFAYDAPSGSVQVEFRSSDGDTSMTIRLATSGAADGRSAGSATVGANSSAGVTSSTTTVSMSREHAGARAALDDLLRSLVDEGASDLHLRVGEPPVIRHDGVLRRTEGPRMEADLLYAMHASVMLPDDRAKFDETGDADYAYEIPGIARFRANAAMDRGGPLAVFRVIPSVIPSCEQMRIAPELQKLCYLNKGLVLVTGPTGSGKSTTLAAMVDLMNREREDHILTIEDPIEFVHESQKCLVTHRQVGLHTQSFKVGLRAALREDPDIVLIGELRDLETVAIAIETAETGHLVFGTLHTTTAASTVDRLIDQFPADQQSQIRVMLSESLRGVISQTLCKKKGGGRIAAREILLTSPAVSNLIREGKTFQLPSIMQTSRKAGMVTLNDALFELLDTDLIEPREAYVRSVEKTGMEQGLKTRGHDVAALLRSDR
jgi:twitching motility protein PilT